MNSSIPPSLQINPRRSASGFAALLAVLVLAIPSAARAASGTWLNTGATDANWFTTSNWASAVVPGATSGTTNADTATFNSAVGTYGTSGTPILIDSGRNLKSITFDLAAAGAYFIGTTGGNALLLTSAGAITMNAAVANTETINAPLVIQGAAGTYAFTNNATDNSKLLNIGGGVTGGAAGATVLTLSGTNTGSNTVSGVIGNGTATTVAVTKSGAGTWVLTGANTNTGATTISVGTLSLAGASGALTGTASFGIGSGATLLVDDSTANANRLKDSAGITFNSAGTFKYIGSNLANSTESIGAITLNNGVATITVNSSGSNTATVTAAAATGGFTRSFSGTNAPGIALINGVNLGSGTSGVGRFLTVTAPTLVGTTNAGTTGITSAKDTKIVAYLLGESGTSSGANGTAAGTANTFLTYNSTNGYRPLNPADEFTNNSILTGNNTYITSATTSSSSAAINSLVINGGNLVINDGTTLTNTSGALLFASNNTIAPSSSTGVLGFGSTEGIISVNSGVNATISSTITGTGGLTLYGPGTLTLSGSSGAGLSNTTNIMNGANLVIGINTALGSSLLRTNGGTVSVLVQPRTISNTLNINSNGSQTLAGTGDLTLAGSGSNPGLSVTHQVNPTLNITNVGTITISGAYALDNGATQNNNAVGPILASSANLIITGPIYDTNSSNVGSGLGSQAAFKFAGAGANLTIIGNNTFGGTQASSTVITPTVGAGYNTITIGGSSSTITPFGLGAINTNSGVGFFFVANASGKTLGNNISLGASTNNDGGRPIGFAGTNDLTLGGTFTLGPSISVPNISSATLTFGNTVTVGGSTLTILGPGNTTFNSAGALSGTTGSFAKTGTGTLTLAGTNNLTGSTTLSGGTVVLDYSTNNNTKLTQNSAAGLATALTLAGVNLQLSGGSFSQTLGTPSSGTNGTTLNAGQSKITQTSGTSTIALGAIARAANTGGAINFGTGAATTTTANNTAGILGGWATVNGTDWAVASGGASAITALGIYTPLPASGAVNTGNYYYTGSTPLTTSGSSPTLGSLKMDASVNLTIGTTSLTTGGLLFTGSSPVSITGGGLNGSNDLIIQNYGTGILTIASIIGTGANALTLAGTGTTVLSNAANSFTGVTFLNGGTVQISAIGNLGASTTSALTFNGATLDVTAAGITNVRPVTLAANGGTIQVDTGTLTFGSAAIISGSSLGGLTKTGAGTLLLQAPSTFVGPVTVSNGTLKLGNAAALGASATGSNRSTAPVLVNGGTLDLASFTAGLGNVTLSSGSIIDSIGGGSVGAYSFTLQSGTVSAALADVAVPVATNLSNSINVYKTTSGTVTLSGANTYTGNTTISGGTLKSANSSALSTTGAVIVSNAGSTLAVNYGGGSDYTQTQVGTLLAKTNFGATGAALGFDTTNASSGATYSNALTMAAGVTKLGTNSLTFDAANTYTGGTTVTAGTLVLAHNNAAGTTGVTVSGSSAATLQINSGITITNSITFSNTNASSAVSRLVANSTAYTVGTGGNLTSSFAGVRPDTTATILAGTNAQGATATLTMKFSDTSAASNDATRTSDVFSLSGTSTDLFVLQLNIPTGLTSSSYVSWLNGGAWVNAVSGNTGNNASLAQQGYLGSFSTFQSTYTGGLSTYVGAYGVDLGSGNVWSVLNHNSDFAVVPEPATWALLAFSLTTVMVLRRRRS